jgi:hypothetical protein
LPGIAPYSSGVVAESGMEIVHVTLASPLPWHAGLCSLRRYLEQHDRTHHSLCGVELRCPVPFTIEGFIAFNTQYRALLKEWDMLVAGQNPVARTNVAPIVAAPQESQLFGFSYTRPSSVERPTFVVAGGGELRGGGLERRLIVRAGETSEDAVRDKARFVVELMRQRLDGLGVAPAWLSTIDVYTAHDLRRALSEELIPGLPAAARAGVHWFYARPPVRDIEFEMDMRGVGCELVLELT